MASNTVKAGAVGGKSAPSNPSSMNSSNPSILLDKFNGRRSTPDSEALASSDDENERQDHPQPTTQPQKPARRASWLNDTTTPTGPQPRKTSFASSSMSPTTSHPSTPSAESSTWGAYSQAGPGVGRGHNSVTTAFSWGSGIWNNDSRKEPPSRLTEVLPSPTSLLPSSGSSYFGDMSNTYRDPPSNPNIPFAIPLHPTPKTYRSQSYSVGQLDPDSPASATSSGNAQPFAGRARPLPHSGLQHRPSRPSMLSEMSNDGALSKLKEVDDDDDDDESTNGSNHGVAVQQSNEAKTIELLARENAMLRQQQYHSRIRPRSSTSNAYGLGGYSLQGTLPEESDYAIDELEELQQDMQTKSMLGRRMSEYGAAGQPRMSSSYTSLENRKIENVKKAYWQSSPGFGGLQDIPQSRRHSFADVPTRQGSISSIGDPLSNHENGLQESMSPKDYQNRYQDGTGYALNDHESCNEAIDSQKSTAASYFGGIATLPRNNDPYGAAAYQAPAYPYANAAAQYGGGQAASPHRSMYGAPQPRHNQLLYIVLFKCSRADVFYVQEGTGLAVKPGDLVIVEADRGTDLGTVARADVDWNTAKELKEHYAEEHYRWLMMYSQSAAGNQDGTGAGLMAASNGLQGSAVGGMGPPNQHGMQDPNPGEIKPKIIKRLAQQHEIQALRDKEGNEAKAKRVCMQKVKEHGLHMEILDAEFQMDWKKLTFYYFADAYINFNSLVTDLFKVYKTRIWMSAINPASFASPSLGLQAPSGIGPGAVGVTRAQPERRPQVPEQPAYPQPARGYQGVFAPPFTPSLDRNIMPPATFQPPGYGYGYSPFNAAPRVQSSFVPLDQYGGFSSQPGYQGLPNRFPSPSAPTDPNDFGRHAGNIPTSNDGWVTTFQGLSMNSH
ncbi:related to suppressor protein PSP1 [Rhynchosporium graminicola]|uniref:Related to suppressor protein PSP1 n=1 Tax=Rhynchosporium graminicola TaxID=2792576 RepID=A0A1E1LEC6_9HELO|nr:related to suppressor protein PSP1 [Rhynchosporium commune]